MAVMILLPPAKNVRHWSRNAFLTCMLDNSKAMKQLTPITTLLATFIGENASDDSATPSSNPPSPESQ